MSMKVLPVGKKHHCPRERCQGDSKQYQNYIAHPSKSKKKLKRPNTTRSQQSVHEHLPKQSKLQPKSKPSKHSLLQKTEIEELKRRHEENLLKNSQLSQQIQVKNHRISELKHRIKDYQARIQAYDEKVKHLQSIINDSEHPKSPMTYSKPSQHVLASYQQQIKTFQTSQKAMIEQMQKCRIIQRQYQQYRNESQRKIQKLVRENQQLRHFQSHQKDYDGEIDQLRQELHKLSQSHSPDKTTVSENQIASLRATNRQLMVERQHLLCRIQEMTIKEGDLRQNLQTINRKVERWGQDYKHLIEQKKNLEINYALLQKKLQHKKERHHNEKEEWARIFRELMYEVQKLKKEIGRLERSNNKLMNLYSQPTE